MGEANFQTFLLQKSRESFMAREKLWFILKARDSIRDHAWVRVCVHALVRGCMFMHARGAMGMGMHVSDQKIQVKQLYQERTGLL